MKVLITGGSGLIGSALTHHLRSRGHDVVALRRPRAAFAPGDAVWNPATGIVDTRALSGADAVIHLAGASIASGRWTKARKARLRDSRIGPTGLLARALVNQDRTPRVFVCASAIGYYGDQGDTLLDESADPGNDFLAQLCRDWEEAAQVARDPYPSYRRGIRVVHLRTGLVLSSHGGALAKMLPPFKLGLGGVMGSGHQYYSWIAIDDVVGAIEHILSRDALSGPVNLTAPDPVTNREFTATLARVLRRPAVFPMPAFAARMLFGEMADALLLSSARVVPSRLTDSGYQFCHPHLEGALRDLLGRPAPER
jgi:uncharacterized protein (TIGR01777 family)